MNLPFGNISITRSASFSGHDPRPLTSKCSKSTAFSIAYTKSDGRLQTGAAVTLPSVWLDQDDFLIIFGSSCREPGGLLLAH